jgi:hypothetical protein
MNSVSADFRSQLDSFRSHEERLQASEATRIVAITLAGRCLANMRDELKEQGISDWEKRLAQEARLPVNELQRRILIGTHWAGSIETAQVQALLAQLPADTLRLEWICKIPMAELPSFLSEVDCRLLDREAVKRAVQTRLGVVNVLREVDRAAKRAATMARNLSRDQQARLVDGIQSVLGEYFSFWFDVPPEADEQQPVEEEDAEALDDEEDGLDDEPEDDEPTSRRRN